MGRGKNNINSQLSLYFSFAVQRTYSCVIVKTILDSFVLENTVSYVLPVCLWRRKALIKSYFNYVPSIQYLKALWEHVIYYIPAFWEGLDAESSNAV